MSKLVISSWLLVHGKKQKTTNYLPAACLPAGQGRQGQLPTTNCKSGGFTMIELLVVISIIAVLTTMSISIYSGIQAKGRDTRRRAEIDEIRKAMELYYTGGTSTPYLAPTGNMFSDGIIPKDPKNISPYVYYFNGSPGLPGSGTFANYTICAKLENKGGNALDQNGAIDVSSNGDFYCKNNAQ